MTYRYRTYQAGENVWCKADDQQYQKKMIHERMRIFSRLMELDSKGKPVFKAPIKYWDEHRQTWRPKKNNYNKVVKKTFRIHDFINTKSNRLSNDGNNGYPKMWSQTPKNFLAGQEGKFADIISNPDKNNLSPVQIKLYNLCATLIQQKFMDVIHKKVWCPNGEDYDIANDYGVQAEWFLDLVASMKIQSENLTLKEQKQRDQQAVSQSHVIQSIA